MTCGPERHHRRSIRLRGYDYAQAGAYFVTACIQERAHLLGEVASNEVRLSDAGQMVERWWQELEHKFPGAETDTFVVMPNHVHGIIVITEGGHPRRGAPTNDAPTGRGRPCVAALSPCECGNAQADVGGHHGLVQDDDHQRIYSWGQRAGVAALPRQVLATELL